MVKYLCALTTVDNPYDPINDFNHWYQYDMLNGYNSCSLLARFCNVPDDALPEEEAQMIESAIDFIVKTDSQNIYKKYMVKNDRPTLSPEDLGMTKEELAHV